MMGGSLTWVDAVYFDLIFSDSRLRHVNACWKLVEALMNFAVDDECDGILSQNASNTIKH